MEKRKYYIIKMDKCPSCGARISSGQIRCPKCGAILPKF